MGFLHLMPGLWHRMRKPFFYRKCTLRVSWILSVRQNMFHIIELKVFVPFAPFFWSKKCRRPLFFEKKPNIDRKKFECRLGVEWDENIR